MKGYTYFIFNFSIHSERQLPFLEEKIITQTPSVKIKFQAELPQLDASKNKDIGVTYECNEDEFLLRMDGVANYFVSNGDTILVQEDLNAAKKDVDYFLINTALIVLIHQRGLIPFRASAIEKGGKGILISGISVAGKSSFTAGLIFKGFNLIADELCVIEEDDKEELTIYSFQNKISLQKNSIDLLKIYPHSEDSIWDSKEPIREGLNRFEVVLKKEKVVKKPISLNCIYILSPTLRANQLSLVKLENPKQLFATLHQQIHLSQLKFSSRHNHSILSMVAALSNKIPVKKCFFNNNENEFMDNLNAVSQELKEELNHE